MSRLLKQQEQRQTVIDGKENVVSFKTSTVKNNKSTTSSIVTNKTPQLKTVVTAQQARTPVNALRNKTNKTPQLKTVVTAQQVRTPVNALRNKTNKTPQLKAVITAQQARTPVSALRDITNKTPQPKTVRLNKDGYHDTPAVTKQQKNSKGMLKDRIVKKSTLKDNLKEEDDVPEIEYCPSPIEELPYEPLDEDLKFDWDALRHPPSVTAYEFENIKYDELPFPEINPDDYKSREVIDDYGK
ncbi:2541_t:CDS:2 [Racocetra fulgida]|uniref:2541_t:CDS:1 n=1 Tax=Racocetra fulgida TaxID=60492 RepID=A0A9N9BYD0_9GLOM|nr:2541_t:CDS:2 [Racocetra fulgida]